MFNSIRPASLFIAALLSVSGVTALADEQTQTEPATQPAAEVTPEIPGYTRAPYPLTTCVISGNDLKVMGEPYLIEVNGREVQLCCKGCENKVRADPATFLKKIDQAVIEQQLDSYPLTTCLIDKVETLGDDAINLVWENRLIRFCCRPCSREFLADPATPIQDLNQAVISSQKTDYPLDTCVVSGEKLATIDHPVDHVVGHQLVRLCCKGCVKKIAAAPAKYLSILDAAQSSGADTTESPTHDNTENTDAGDHHGHDSHDGH
jgi:hypothetical protein